MSQSAADRLRRLRRTDSQVKTARVRATLDATATAGETMSVAQIARTAERSSSHRPARRSIVNPESSSCCRTVLEIWKSVIPPPPDTYAMVR